MTLCFTVIGLGSHTIGWVTSVGVAAGLLPVAVTWLRELATGFQVRADKCRRLILYSDGLGIDVSAASVAEVKAWAAGKALAEAPFVRPFYSSIKAPGPQRLADIVTESAFFTEHLAAKIQFWLWAIFGLTLVASIFALNLADLAIGTSQLLLVAKSIAVFIAFVISGDVALLAKKYGDLRSDARHAFQRCAQLRDMEKLSHDEVREVVEDYGIALLQCPPIPAWVYKWFRDPLNDIYRDCHQRT